MSRVCRHIPASADSELGHAELFRLRPRWPIAVDHRLLACSQLAARPHNRALSAARRRSAMCACSLRPENGGSRPSPLSKLQYLRGPLDVNRKYSEHHEPRERTRLAL
jgi:hypothetical protein